MSAAWASRGQAIDHGQVVRVALGAEDFDRLIAGEMARVRGITPDGVIQVEIILSDIGFDRMQAAVNRASAAAAERLSFGDADP
ncbi:MAG TPA: hypothetical protein VGF39_04070 [Stellaceae bacterium]